MGGVLANQGQTDVVGWVAECILPHEPKVRAWLARTLAPGEDPDDVIQEAYCRLASLDEVGHVRNPRAYFFQTARSIVLERIRRSRIVRIETVTEIDTLPVIDDEPSPERTAGARRELQRVLRLIEALPERYRKVVKLRKIEGLSQKEIAARLGVSERVVENDATRGLRLILRALEAEENAFTTGDSKDEKRARRHESQ